MKYSYEITNGVLILSLSGDLIGENHGPELISLVNDTINDETFFCAIDISEVRYINSSGIGVLITILTKFRNKGGEVVLVQPSETVKRLLAITKLSSIFSIVGNQEEALQELIKS